MAKECYIINWFDDVICVVENKNNLKNRLIETFIDNISEDVKNVDVCFDEPLDGCTTEVQIAYTNNEVDLKESDCLFITKTFIDC